jgi:hypothetical protein
MKTSRQMLAQVGFEFDERILAAMMAGRLWGKTEAEPYNVGKNHFTPRFRSVFIGECANGSFYVTSHIHGEWRGYRCRHKEDVSIANIFASGKTELEAVEKFIHNFTNKIYNKR